MLAHARLGGACIACETRLNVGYRVSCGRLSLSALTGGSDAMSIKLGAHSYLYSGSRSDLFKAVVYTNVVVDLMR